jgi:ribosome biogenesis protein MAK21
VDAGAQGDNGDDDNDSEMDLDIAELESGDDVLIGSDEDIRSDILIPMEDEVDDDTSKGRRIKKRKLKQLPIFAAAEDYAELVGNDEDEDF